MLKNKDGEDVELKDALSYLQGTDDLDMASSVIDFAVYPVVDGELGDPQYYLIGTEVIVTQISFIGPFISVELDFRNVGLDILRQVMDTVKQFHDAVNSENVVMLSTITPLSPDATHTLSLADPLVCIRGYSDTGNATTALHLIYSADNAAFSAYEIDYEAVNAEINRELQEMESYEVTSEALAAAESAMEENDNDERMREMFRPRFGFREPNGKKKNDSPRIESGHKAETLHTNNSSRIGLTSNEDRVEREKIK